MAKFGKWLGGGLGWAFGGPLGGLLGFALGNLFDVANISTFEDKQDTGTHPGDFSVSLLVLAAAVIKADGKVLKSEIEYIKEFFVKQFGVEKAQEQLLILRELLKQEVPLANVCIQIRQNMSVSMRLQLIHFLFGISAADNHIHANELSKIDEIAHLLGLNQNDIASIKAMFYRDETADYKILEIEANATDDEVKKAYRRMAVKYHPDKVAQLGADVQKAAEEKFKKVQEAYENIKKSRNT